MAKYDLHKNNLRVYWQHIFGKTLLNGQNVITIKYIGK